MLDMSTSVVAANKVKVYALNGKPIPSGWVIDADGQPLTDSEVAYRLLFEGSEGGLAPIGGVGKEMGGHKGYGLGIFAQILASTLSGGVLLADPQPHAEAVATPTISGISSWRSNPAAFRPLDDFQGDLDDVVETLAGDEADRGGHAGADPRRSGMGGARASGWSRASPSRTRWRRNCGRSRRLRGLRSCSTGKAEAAHQPQLIARPPGRCPRLSRRP